MSELLQLFKKRLISLIQEYAVISTSMRPCEVLQGSLKKIRRIIVAENVTVIIASIGLLPP